MALLAAPSSASALGPISSFGPPGTGPGQIGYPTGVAVRPDGRTYVVDYEGNRVSAFSPSGSFLFAFGKSVRPSGGNTCTAATGCQKGVGDGSAGSLWGPIGLTIDPAGTVYVTAGNGNRVDVFSAEGDFIRAFGKNVKPGGGNVCTTATGCQQGMADYSAGSLTVPLGIAVDSAGLLYVTTIAYRVEVFSREGSFIRAFGKNVNPAGGDTCTAATGCQQSKEFSSAGGMSLPYGIAVSPGGLVALGDYGNRRIDIFGTGGNFIRAFGRGVNPGTDTAVYGVCTAATGCRSGTEGSNAGAVNGVVGMAFDAQGHVLAADNTNNRVSEFGSDGSFIRAFGEGVTNGEATFQVCTTATGCRAGLTSTSPGSLGKAFAVTTDCRGAIYASAWSQGASALQVKRLGEPGTPLAPCPPPSAAGDAGSAGASLAGAFDEGRPRTAKPSIKIELNRGTGTAALIVIVSDPGTLTLQGKGIRKVVHHTKRSGLIELLLIPKGALKRKLAATGKAAVKFTLAFKADSGALSTQAKAVGLKMNSPS